MARRFVLGCAVSCLLLAGGVVAEQRPQDLDLQKAIRTETVAGDLAAAIRQYEALVATYASTDRAIAAEALLRMADVYQKLGDAEARNIYARVIRDYRDQKEAALARVRLDANSQTAPVGGTVMGPRVVWSFDQPADIYAGLSSDGRYLAYANYRTGDLFVRDLDSGINRRITVGASIPGEHTKGGAFFSRDGRQLAYEWFMPRSGTREAYAELRVVTIDGASPGEPRVLVKNPDIRSISPYGWTLDGAFIVVQVGRPDKTFQLGMVSTRDGALRVLKSNNWRDGGSIFVSPDGRSVAFDQPAAGTNVSDIFVLALDGSREIPAVVNPAADKLAGWAPDGRALLFTSDRTGAAALWSVPFSPGEGPGTEVLVRRDIGRFNWPLGVTASGSLFVHALFRNTTTTAVSNVMEGAFDYSTGQMLTAPRVTVHEFVGTNENPTWSPDGRFLSWISQRGASPAPVRNHLVVRALDSGQTRTFEVALNFPPNRSMWAPDSRAMIVQGSEPGGRQGIFRIDTATGRMSPIVMATGAQDLLQLLPIDQSWSPDGRRFYFRRFTQRGGSLVDLVERDLSSGDDRQLFVGPRVTLSPDRRTAYYRREIPNGRQVPHEMRTSDGQSSLGTVPETALIARDLASGTERELIRRVMFPVLARGPDLSPDGRHILVTTLDAEAGIWLVGMVSTEGGQYRELWRQSSATRQPGGNWAPGGRSVIVWSPLTNRIGEPAENWWVPLDGRERRRLDPASPLGNVHPDGRRTVFVSRPASEPKQVLVFDQVAAASVPAR